MPREYEIGRLIDRFGAGAVYGRLLGVGEMRRIMRVEAIIDAYNSRATWRDKDGNPSMSDWAQKHAASSRMLNDAMKAAGNDDE